ncbi:hypothetical protein Mgra_00004371 [Meloidogyne graminicola]|uniref:Uncharacterized protein n=1 Tax=Meloidogyne graminicola TaxID=189291 RepID=A0A8S9ZS16_9BILA|nr:hypothetical protein Mgra_00004371 [Meloidogyne graminicola]
MGNDYFVRINLSTSITYYIESRNSYTSDKIPLAIQKYPASLVVNLDAEANKGTHWIALFIINNNTIYIFDSLSIKNLPTAIDNYISKFTKQIKNKIPIQSPLSITCGQHLLFSYILSHSDTHMKNTFHC